MGGFLSMAVLPSPDSKATPQGTVTLKEACNCKDLLIVDVRSSDEYKSGHHSLAKSIPISEFQDRVSELGPDQKRPIIIHCMRGMRAGSCAEIAKSKGYVNVFTAANQEEVTDILSKCGCGCK